MKRKKTSSIKRKAKGGSFLNSGHRDLLNSLFLLMLKGPVVFFVLILLGIVFVSSVSDHAKDNPRFTVHNDVMRCISRPAWLADSDRLTSKIIRDIQTGLDRLPSDSIFSQLLEEELVERASSLSPWIESIECFKRAYPSQYKIQLKLRRPVAVFRSCNRSYYIDGQGVVIAGADYLDREEVTTQAPLITGFDPRIPVRVGQAALSKRLIEGAAVAKEIEIFSAMGVSEHITITEIDVSNYGSGLPDDTVLITDNDVKLLWGRSARNSRFKGIDLTPRTKTLNLKKVLIEKPALVGVKEVKLNFDVPTIVNDSEG